MKDFWSFLLQTLTVSGVAVLVLCVKAMFRDKFSPRWQFWIWGLVALTMVVPAGFSGRYTLINWPLLVETMKSYFTGEYGTITKVAAPIPLPVFGELENIFDWIYGIYVAGVIFFLVRYFSLYFMLRLALARIFKKADFRAGKRYLPEDAGREDHSVQKYVDFVADKYHLSSCRVVQEEGLESAFICGLFRPVLVLPAGLKTDEKVILHELLHLKYHDVLWGLAICLFRSLHWCNPLIWACANLAGNNLESLCDQRVLERLSGEERRDYGRILLEMTGVKYARMPGTSSAANGGKNIRRRIVAITRFKRYPAGMGFVSGCILLVLSVPLIVGTKPEEALGKSHPLFCGDVAEMAQARIISCTTIAGAFDTYAKAVLNRNIPYLAICAPLDRQEFLAKTFLSKGEFDSLKNMALPVPPDPSAGYKIYNLNEKEEDIFEGILVLKLSDSLCTEEMGERGDVWFGAQSVLAKKQGDRFVVIPQEEFIIFEGDAWLLRIPLGGNELPAWNYKAVTKDFSFTMRWQTAACVENQGISGDGYDLIPQPDGEFTVYSGYKVMAHYIGKPEDKCRYEQFGHVGRVVWDRTKETKDSMKNIVPEGIFGLGKYEIDRSGREPGHGTFYGSSSDGSSYGTLPYGEGFSDEFMIGGQGGNGKLEIPDCYMMEIYINNKLYADPILELLEGSGGYGR